MRDSLQNSVALILVTGSRLNEKAFGTGFAIYNKQCTYILTCTHVIQRIDNPKQIQVNGSQAEVVVSSPEDSADLAVLCVEKQLDIPQLPLSASGKEGMPFRIPGFQSEDKRYVNRPLAGTLGRQNLMRGQADSMGAWDLVIKRDTPYLQHGYSGSPVIDERGRVIGVVQVRHESGNTGIAISIDVLKNVWPDMPPDLVVQYKAPASRSQLWWKVALLFLVLLLLGGGALYYARNPLYSSTAIFSGTPSVHTTSSVANTATSTTSAPTQVPSPGSTVSPPPKSAIPANWHLAFNDPLTAGRHDSAWDPDPPCTFTTSYYEENSTNLNFCTRGTSTANSIPDLSYTIDVSIHQGNQGGLVVRKANNNYYYFTITATGEYALTRHSAANGGDDTTIKEDSSSAIHQGFDQWNTLQIVVQGSSFTLYINGQFITAQSDGTLTYGAIAVIANNSDVRFRNVVVYTP